MNREEILLTISEADEDFIEDILTEAVKRKELLYPDWKIRYLAVLGTDKEEERRRYEQAWRALTDRA